MKSPLNNSGGGGGGSVTPSSSASLKGLSKSALPPSLGQHSTTLQISAGEREGGGGRVMTRHCYRNECVTIM